MKVQMLSIMAGPEGSFHPKDVVDFPTEKAKDLIKGGYAVAVPQSSKVTKKAVQVVQVEDDDAGDEDDKE